MGDPRDAREFFDAQAEEYARSHYDERARTFMSVRLERVLELVDALDLPPGARVLDAGCGPGHLVRGLTLRGLEVCALDASQEMLAEARRRLQAQPKEPAPVARFARGSIDRLPLPTGGFDLVCSTGVIEYLPRDEPCLAEFHRVLRPGGHLVLSVTNALSPVLLGDSVVEAVKRSVRLRGALDSVLARWGQPPIRPRHFPVRRHRPARFREELARAGFELRDAVHFYFLPWPRPLDRLLPRASARAGAWMERLARTPVGGLAEGYLVSCRRG